MDDHAWSRRDVLKSGLAASVAALVPGADTRIPGPATDSPAPKDSQPRAAPRGRERLLMDFGWRFHLGHADDPDKDFGWGRGRMFAKTGDVFSVSDAKFDDADWRAVDLPHDWAVELPFENARELIEFGAKPLGRGYPASSIGWYRRVFDLPASDRSRRLSIEFDGVFRDCMVVLNGHLLGRNLSGYAPFRYDITDYVEYGGKNVLVVRVDATGREGWFYEGAGIYRHVWLVKTAPVHVGHWGTFVRSDIGRDGARLTIATEVVNDTGRDVPTRVVSTVRDPAGAIAGVARTRFTRVAAASPAEVIQELTIAAPKLWSVETPQLYTLITTIEIDAGEVDRYETPFGIRSLRFDADQGFFLNGERVELKGTCNHQDHAGVGSALPDRLQYYRIEKLKAMGSNAYRTSHNPPTPELLDACDRLGMLVLDETRLFAATEEGRSQLERMIRRDRNRPSVFCWSVANEEWNVQGTERGTRIGADLVRLVRRLDPTRPITAAMDGSWGKGIALVMDVQGCNYERPNNPDTNLDAFHQRFPSRPMMGTEVASTYCTRGVYANDTARGYVSAYDVNKPGYGATAQEWWTRFVTRPHIAGGFVWTGFDYRGEPSPYAWPCISSHFGIMDTCGFPKDNFYYYQAWWGTQPVLHLFPHWNWRGQEGQEIEVWVHTNLDRVKLTLNGRSLGTLPVERNSHLVWKVPYEPGVLEAHGLRGTTEVLVARRMTSGAPARLLVTSDRARVPANGEDVAVVTVSALDTQQRPVPVADNAVTFRLTGNAKLIGVGNGDPSSHEADKGDTRQLFNGFAVAFVQAGKQPGNVTLEASSPGLQGDSVVLALTEAPLRAALG